MVVVALLHRSESQPVQIHEADSIVVGTPDKYMYIYMDVRYDGGLEVSFMSNWCDSNEASSCKGNKQH